MIIYFNTNFHELINNYYKMDVNHKLSHFYTSLSNNL